MNYISAKLLSADINDNHVALVLKSHLMRLKPYEDARL